jgi:hypothetical protein
VFLGAGIMQWVESEALSNKQKEQCSASGCLNFLDAYYYIVVTVSYGTAFLVFIFLFELNVKSLNKSKVLELHN